MPALPVAESPWFRSRAITATLVCVDEPSVHELLRANIWWMRGRDRDLIVDTGLGVASLRAHLPQLFTRDPIVVLTHAHLDHMGGAHEFDRCWAHPGEPFADPPPGSLWLKPLADELGIATDPSDSETILVDALPQPGYAPDDYRLQPAPPIQWLHDGQQLDLGDRRFTVLHLPGHTPGGVALYDENDGTQFSGDVVYDDILIDDCVGADVTAYRASMQRLIDLDAAVIRPGHGDSFDGARLRRLAREYLQTTGNRAAIDPRTRE